MDAAETMGITALSFLAAHAERLDRFLDLTGLSPQTLRAASAEPRFFASVLDHILGDDRLLAAFEIEAGIPPASVEAARKAFGRDETWDGA